ncbi:hypothetical protein ACFFUT_09605 [Pseudohalocynthiibacter aestuariivivens]|uniref:Uncharacterized protein n=1 Tax=Pseudohalocynthiibacter aestuariivivens TaxID=1591409 RepID=A0ABV5JF05_9RHOB|nr:hypothetical protein [Pseudohalocynthiibacter aestuariivivens]MBS9719046.1 hypothetical protein [Pseudohalocynthiibacter aestuariivivens]
MNCYSINRRWFDRFLPEIKQIVGAQLLREAPDEQDWHNATDLMLFDARDIRVAARVRRPGYVHRYPYQFTIRARVTSGAETELSKIVNGKGDWMFYGHSNERQDGFALWWLIDLNAFWAALIRQTANGYRISCGDMANSDGTCFKWFDIRSFPTYPPLVVARSRILP